MSVTLADPPVEAPAIDCRQRLIEAATAVFIEEGYRASIERVASRAGVARQTLYNHFPGKADLFGEVVLQATAALLVTLDGKGDTLRERLLRFALMYRGKVLSVEGLGFFRALAAESTRFPELAATFYRTGPRQTESRLSKVLDVAMANGELRQDDSLFAARLFLSMLVGTERTRYLFSDEALGDPCADAAAGIVDAFLRAFAPEPA